MIDSYRISNYFNDGTPGSGRVHTDTFHPPPQVDTSLRVDTLHASHVCRYQGGLFGDQILAPATFYFVKDFFCFKVAKTFGVSVRVRLKFNPGLKLPIRFV